MSRQIEDSRTGSLRVASVVIDVGRYAQRFATELGSIRIPDLALIERTLTTPVAIEDVAARVRSAIDAIAPNVAGRSIAIAVGSRGIARLDEIVRATVTWLRNHGAEPFIVTAMGSHGASTAAGQADVLAHLGITEATVGAPIRATMDVVHVGKTPAGIDVFVDALAYAADGIVVINRVKPHTSFRGPIESGPAKMLAIGLGKAEGARSVHADGWARMREHVPAAAATVLSTGKVSFALGIVENAREAPCRIEAIEPSRLLAREAELLVEATANLARLPLIDIDVLVVDRVGKNISGTGADPNVTGRYPSPFVSGGANVTRLVYLGFTPEADGNANGIGLADVVTADLAARYDPLPTYLNALTTTAAPNARLPMVMPTAELAIAAALRMCPGIAPADAAVVRIADTLHLTRLLVSKAVLEKISEPFRLLRDFTPCATPLANDGDYVFEIE